MSTRWHVDSVAIINSFFLFLSLVGILMESPRWAGCKTFLLRNSIALLNIALKFSLLFRLASKNIVMLIFLLRNVMAIQDLLLVVDGQSGVLVINLHALEIAIFLIIEIVVVSEAQGLSIFLFVGGFFSLGVLVHLHFFSLSATAALIF